MSNIKEREVKSSYKKGDLYKGSGYKEELKDILEMYGKDKKTIKRLCK